MIEPPTDDEIREMMRTPLYDFYRKYGVFSNEAFAMFEEQWKRLSETPEPGCER